MALHQTHQRAGGIGAVSTYASSLSSRPLPKRRMPDTGVSPAVAEALVRDELLLDGSSRQNLATFCTTRVAPEVRQLMNDCIDKNMIDKDEYDKDEYPQTAEIESRCVHMLADLSHAPDAGFTIGCSTTGSSEAAMLGGLALKWRWREKRRAASLPADRPGHAGFSLYDLSDRVRMRGWQIASYPLPPDRQDTVVQRILIRSGVSRDMATLLAADIRSAPQHFARHPIGPVDEHRPGFHH